MRDGELLSYRKVLAYMDSKPSDKGLAPLRSVSMKRTDGHKGT